MSHLNALVSVVLVAACSAPVDEPLTPLPTETEDVRVGLPDGLLIRRHHHEQMVLEVLGAGTLAGVQTASFTPDHERVVYAREQELGSLLGYWNPYTGDITTIYKPDRHLTWTWRFSADGDRMCVSGYDHHLGYPNQHELHLVDLATGEFTQLEAPQFYSLVAVNTGCIVRVSETDEPYIDEIDAMGRHRLYDPPTSNHIAPDGSWMSYNDAAGNTVLAERDGRRTIAVDADDRQYAGSASRTTDGRWLMMRRNRVIPGGGVSEMRFVVAHADDPSPVHIDDHFEWAPPPIANRSNTTLVYGRQNEGWQIVVLTLGGEAEVVDVPLPLRAPDLRVNQYVTGGPTYSPNGTQLLFNRDYETFVFDLRTKEVKQVTDLPRGLSGWTWDTRLAGTY